MSKLATFTIVILGLAVMCMAAGALASAAAEGAEAWALAENARAIQDLAGVMQTQAVGLLLALACTSGLGAVGVVGMAAVGVLALRRLPSPPTLPSPPAPLPKKGEGRLLAEPMEDLVFIERLMQDEKVWWPK